MAEDLARQRCFNHARREAVARCPECGRYFCRECVTEHEDRVLCASCLTRLTRDAGRARRSWRRLTRLFQCVAGVLILWLCFYVLGRGLLALPSSFHEGAVWQVDTWDEPESP